MLSKNSVIMGSNSSSCQNIATCVPIEPPSNPNESSVYINSIRLKENGGLPITTPRCQPNSLTITDILDTSASIYRNNDCVGERIVNTDGSYGRYKWQTYSEFRELCLQFAAGLQSIGIKKGDKIGIFSHSCIFWQVAFFGSLYIGATPVTVYESFGADAAEYIIKHSRCSCLIINGQNMESAKSFLPKIHVKHLVVIAHLATPPFICIDDIIEKGIEYSSNSYFQRYRPEPDDVAIIMYTSGSSGVPKGCVLTHKNLVAGATGLGSAGTSMTTRDTYFSYLPLAHIYELCCQIIMLAQGVRIGFFSGDTRAIYKDCKALQPTVMCGVPRIFNRLVDSIKKAIEEMHPLLKWLMMWAIDTKSKQLFSHEHHSLFMDYFLFPRFREELGGRLRLIVIGGAPILPEIYDLLRAIITPNIIQGYGLTEICAAGCLTEIGNENPASVGAVSIASDMKFRRVEGMDYDPTAAQPSGELLFRGPSIFKGYLADNQHNHHKQELHENECFTDTLNNDSFNQNNDNDSDGIGEDGFGLMEDESFDGEWYATGDIGFLNTEEHVQIIDRVKQLVKLSHGEYISLTNLSEKYCTTPGVKYIYVFADSHHNQPVAVVIPTQNCIDDWVGRGIKTYQSSEIAKSEVLKKLSMTAEHLNLRRFERIFDVILEPDIFSVQNGLLTPSMKPHIYQFRMKYEARLLELYNKPSDTIV
ncbi:AMP-binding enzyme family protein [Tritrichomonas foetus]|uniref:AMP-binding enzyme family protein n=1 Tax=Tritrichomonas foetus TaxID=1144522 RepID=A0A1J4JCZ8_9EUKA|nr:AMP-binding enzyme family protein [Tritrichomonas foetus]|eukprot:OHS95148.1 AMP-binding enzyme family protein [Tritrichomonas foetus]